MKTILIVLALTFFWACQVEQQTNYTAYIKNATSSHSIKILFYKSGIVYPSDTINLVPGQQFQIARGFDRGLSDKPGFSSRYYGRGEDSMIVIFDNTYRVAHYGIPPAQPAPKYYLFESLRNIGNAKSFRTEVEHVSKNVWDKDHYYEFVEQDYLDAK